MATVSAPSKVENLSPETSSRQEEETSAHSEAQLSSVLPDVIQNGTSSPERSEPKKENEAVSGDSGDSQLSKDQPEVTENGVSEAEDEYLDVLGSGLLKKKVLKAGKPNSRPVTNSLVTARAQVFLEDGTCVEDSVLTYMPAESDVILGIDMCTSMMDDGEIAEIIAAPRFAYGPIGKPPKIPGNATLTIRLEILSLAPPPDIMTMPVEDLLKFGEQKRERGNEWFSREEFSIALSLYSSAIRYFEAEDRELKGDQAVIQQLSTNRIKCYNNMAAAQLKIGASNAVIRSCNIVLRCEPNNVKALYRKGKAFCANGEIDKAVTTIKKAIQLDPSSKLLHRELSLWTQRQKRQMESEKNMYRKMMGTLADAAVQDDKKSSNSNMMKLTLIVGGVIAAMFSVGFAYFRTTH